MIEGQVEDLKVLEEWLSVEEIKHHQRSRREAKKQLLEVKKNGYHYEASIEMKKPVEERAEDTLKNLPVLNLEQTPQRIECFDISNIQGVDSVASMVVFEDGKPKRSDYRRFKIRTVEGPDDYAGMEEIIGRRFRRGMEETRNIIEGSMEVLEGKFAVFPDLIMVDGGLGQVGSAKKSLNSLKLDIPVCGIVKDEKHRTKGLVYEGNKIYVKKVSGLFRFITKIQDEAHRFAVNYHRSLRKKSILQSILEEIPGIGEVRKRALMVHFRTIDRIKNATLEELLEVKEINEKVAKNVMQFSGNTGYKIHLQRPVKMVLYNCDGFNYCEVFNLLNRTFNKAL